MKLAYICDFCGAVATEDQMRAHERNCDYNFLNETCYTCSKATFYGGIIRECEEGIRFQEQYSNPAVKRNCIYYDSGKPCTVTPI